MPNGLAGLLHDAAVLHRLVDFLEEYCKEQKRSQTYVDASGLFFDYVEKLTEGIKRMLAKEIDRAGRFPKRLPLLRRQLLTLKYYLRLLHALLKPAADAHTLTIPAPLIDLASEQIQRVDSMRNSKVVILLTPEFMYFQRPHTRVKEQARIVESFVPDAVFPAKLGFIELPYSQGPSFFTNLAIYHEIGHFVFEELSNTAHPGVQILRSATDSSLKRIFRGRQIFAIVSRIVEDWTQEIFCDLFAIRLMGPAFSFALVEILGMLGFLSRKAAVKFSPTHPASACRFAEHVNMLQEDLWWNAITDLRADQKDLLKRLSDIPPGSYKFYVDDKTLGPQSLVEAFIDFVIPAIRNLVREITPDPERAVKRFQDARRGIEGCLRAGVIPHSPAGNIDPISIINSSFCFYLTSLSDVIAKFEGSAGTNDAAKQSLWTKRLEMWTMKAIEDSQILQRFRTAESHGLI